jgi:aryl-phospho-beta-D-glucosidase BglC (GH1 family)
MYKITSMKTKSRNACCLSLCLLIALSCDSCSSSYEVPSMGQGDGSSSSVSVSQTTGLSATDFVSNIKLGWNLGNTLDAYPKIYTEWEKEGTIYSPSVTEKCWGNPLTTEALIDTVKASGFNAIRVPVTWYEHMDSNNQIDASWLERAKEVVDYVLNADLTCIINVHHDTGTKGWLFADPNDEDFIKEESKFKKIWIQIADYFKDYSEKLLFEGMNEILNKSSTWAGVNKATCDIVNQLNQDFVNIVRKSTGNNPTRVLVLNTYAASAAKSEMANFVFPTDTMKNKLVLSVHAYTPYSFCSGETDTYKESDIDGFMSNLNNIFIAKGYPVIIGEFGVKGSKSSLDKKTEWATYYLKKAKTYGIKCYWWDDGGSYKIINRHNNTELYPTLIDSMMLAA